MESRYLWFVPVLFSVFVLRVFSLDKCSQDKLTYEFTECDSAEGRWRVAVPKQPDSCEASEIPVRQKTCIYTCDPGHYVDVASKTLECIKCPKGTYSVGGGVRFNDWDKLPTGFDSRISDEHYSGYGYDSEYFTEANGANCSKTGWTPQGDHIASPGDECTSELSYAVTLQKDGHVSFDYYFTDDTYTVFRVFVRNDQCKVSSLDNKDTYIRSSHDNEWLNTRINLKAGRNVIIWQATAITYGGKHDNREPVYIKSIEIQGVSYTSECTPCEAGFYNDEEAQGSCKMCPVNTFSAPHATECSMCNEVTEYAGRGATNCTLRKPCTEQDYYDIRTACDTSHKTQVKYMWIEPKICREDVDNAKKLPPSGAKEDCPPCNPGMHANSTGACGFCPVNHFSDGKAECKKCPVSTEAVYGYHLRWWRNIPEFVSASCFSMSDRGCTSKQGWQPRGNYLDSGNNQADDVYMSLKLPVKGFGSSEGLANARQGQYGVVEFVFEMICEGECTFKFKERPRFKGTSLIETWTGRNGKQKYSYIISSRRSTEFIWIFQKESSFYFENEGLSHTHIDDRVKIYSITVNNTVDGGADHCRECPVSSGNGCISCPKGNYVDTKNHQCVPCPKDTYLNTSNPYGADSCIPCGPGLKSEKGSTLCHSDCHYYSVKHMRMFNLTDLQGTHSVASAPSFTSRGFRYYHLINLSLCGHPYQLAKCHSNISLSSGKSEYYNLTSPVCRMTVVPGPPQLVTTQTISLADRLVGIFEDMSDNSTNETSVFAEKGGPVKNTSTFFLFKFHSGTPTQACPNGRSVWTTVMCDVTAGTGELDMPSKCPDGTCDGCRFEFLWRTKIACPVCTVFDYKKVKSSCESGKKSLTYMWRQPKLCRDGVPLPPVEYSDCEIWEQSVGSALKDFKIGIAVVAALVVLMICTMFGLWYKNRKLNYKYHRLVASSDRPGELPQVEKCVVDDDEEDEEEVHFKVGKDRGKKILKKIKDMASGGKKKEKVTFDDDDDEYFESVHLESGKEGLTDDFN